MLAGRMRVSVKSSGSCSGGSESESESESSSIRACWDMLSGKEKGGGVDGGWLLGRVNVKRVGVGGVGLAPDKSTEKSHLNVL